LIAPEVIERANRAIERFAAGEIDVNDVVGRFREADVFRETPAQD
jgi:hypothetical protein